MDGGKNFHRVYPRAYGVSADNSGNGAMAPRVEPYRHTVCCHGSPVGRNVHFRSSPWGPLPFREGVMSLVRLLGFTTLDCGCVVGRYREVATSREVAYVEEKGKACASHGHRRNHTVAAARRAPRVALNKAS